MSKKSKINSEIQLNEEIEPLPQAFSKLKPFFSEEITPFMNSMTIQILLIRQVLDYTILRTEDSRELNTVELPKSFNNTDRDVYGLFLASKQKSVESRKFMEFFRTISSSDYIKMCHLPMNLCMKCPRCVLFGSVKPSGGTYNIKHRVEYSSAFSLLPFNEINETITFNAVNESNQKTGQALNVSHNFKPLTIFPSIVTLKSVTWKEFTLFIKTLLASHSYGAETRVKGDLRNEIIGIVAGYEEIITPLELNLELKNLIDGNEPLSLSFINTKLVEILEKYKQLSSSVNDIFIPTQIEFNSIMDEIKQIQIEKLVESMEVDATKFISLIEKSD